MLDHPQQTKTFSNILYDYLSFFSFSCFFLFFSLLYLFIFAHFHQVSCMVLVNIIVNGPDELRIRSLLRNEFFQLGLEGMLKVHFD